MENVATMTREEMEAEIIKLREEKKKSIKFKVSDKGALSVYGLQRFPVTLYVNQWETLLGARSELEKFISDNRSKLKNNRSED